MKLREAMRFYNKKPGMKGPPQGYSFAYIAKSGDTVSIWSNVPKGLKLGQKGKVISKDGDDIIVSFGKKRQAHFHSGELIQKVKTVKF